LQSEVDLPSCVQGTVPAIQDWDPQILTVS